MNTAGGGTETYSYDKASNLITTTDGFGTTTNSYDTSNVLTSTKYPHNGSFQYLYCTTDGQGHRTDTYLQSDSTKTYWQGHTHYSYDTSGRFINVTAQTGSAPTTITTVFNTDYCYNSGSATPTSHCRRTRSSLRSEAIVCEQPVDRRRRAAELRGSRVVTLIAAWRGSVIAKWRR